MAFKFLTFSILVMLASAISCQMLGEPFLIKRVEKPVGRGEFDVISTSMDEAMVMTVKSGIDAAFANYPNSVGSRVKYVKELLDVVYPKHPWQVIEDFSQVANSGFEHIYLITNRNSVAIHYLIWSTY